MKVRPAEPRDLDVLVAHTKQESFESEGYEADCAAGVAGLLASHVRGCYFVGELEGKVVASMAVTREWSDWRGKNYLIVTFVFVDSSHRGRGLFGELWREVVSLMSAEEEFCSARLMVNKSNARAIAAYVKNGFSELPYVCMGADLPNVLVVEKKKKHAGVIVEVCCDTLESVAAACRGGAHRIELCSALGVGGLTPSVSFVRRARAIVSSSGCCCELIALIRIRAGSFFFSSSELDCMAEDMSLLVPLVDAFAVGALDASSLAIDVSATRALVAAAGRRICVFHRAFDCLGQPLRTSMAQVAATGCVRVLSSGGGESAERGASELAEMVRWGEEEGVEVVAAAGVTARNVAELVAKTRVRQVHGSFSRPVVVVRGDGERLGMGQTKETCEEEVRRAVQATDDM